jgi:hypothetical protein
MDANYRSKHHPVSFRQALVHVVSGHGTETLSKYAKSPAPDEIHIPVAYDGKPSIWPYRPYALVSSVRNIRLKRNKKK